MKILLVHPEDDPEKGPWSNLRWDRIVDLGLGGQASYARWAQRFGCDVTSINSFRHGLSDFHRVRDLLQIGCGRLVDEYGLDWWELTSIYVIEELEALILLQRFAVSLQPDDEVHVSRPGFQADLMRCLLRKGIGIFPQTRARRHGVAHHVRIARKLSLPQILDSFWDKYDSGYQFRARFPKEQKRSSQPVVLLPTAYVNVSRTGIAYADTLPGQNFLMLATRRSGSIRPLPSNVQFAWLSHYAVRADRTAEAAAIEIRWRSLLKELVAIPEFQ
jgi:hypothetical protein